ncbi:MAG: D-aminoacyl-tRNA deacylase [Gammaproteobacteria bacterium]
MISLIQRVSEARVTIDHQVVGEINNGILALIGVEKNDGQQQADRLLQKMLGYRIFEDSDGKMNLCLRDIAGGLLLVPQFTLAADTNKGMRPGFSAAADPDEGKCWFEYLLKHAQQQYSYVESGRFGSDMQVSLVNQGPATFWLQT